MKSLSFNQDQNSSNRKNNLSGGETKKFKSTKYEKIKFEEFNNNNNSNNANNSNLSIKKLLDMSEQNLYKYIITQKGSRDAQNIIKKVNEND